MPGNDSPDFPSNTSINGFQKKILAFYEDYGRSMPWRDDVSPYSIFLSEVMLQQTQVSRVTDYYWTFMNRFPDFSSLADAELQEVLDVWKGLGYNRRARFLREAARIICEQYAGRLPADPDELIKLPGIGKNTAGSISAFAFNLPVAFIETNIRRVFIYEFFPGDEEVHDRRIMPLIEATLPQDNARRWYWALMDYGVSLKGEGRQANRKSAHYSRQSPFEGSARQLRGEILRQLGRRGGVGIGELDRGIRAALPKHPYDVTLLTKILSDLDREGFVTGEAGGIYRIAD